MARRAVLWRALAAVGGLALAGALTVAVVPAGALPGDESSSAVPAVDWAPCTTAGFAGFDCATYRVPLDYDDPESASVQLALVRRPADDPASKIGSLFLNPGGPGESGIAFARGAVTNLFNSEIRQKFDIIGFDPRGVGQSTAIQCYSTDAEWQTTLGPALEVPISLTEIATTLRAYQTYSQDCGANVGRLLEHVSTLDVARDLDLLRQAVGDGALTYAGYSYGTAIGATYANLFPDKVRAVLLDGMVDPAERTQRSLLNELNRAGGLETALNAFLRACEAAGPACDFSPGDPARKFAELRERLRREPAVVNGTTRTISWFTNYVGLQLYRPSMFAALASTLQMLYAQVVPDAATSVAGQTTEAVRQRAASALASADVEPLGEAYAANAFDVQTAVNCVDKRLPRGQTAWPLIASVFEALNRTFGRYQAFSGSVCGTWPVVTDERYAGPWDRPTANTLLVVGIYYDPATPYLFAQRAVGELGNARLLSLAGYGHTSIRSTSTCLAQHTNAYLLTGVVPPDGTVCRPNSMPFGLPVDSATPPDQLVLPLPTDLASLDGQGGDGQ
jgi:pimeloyl-ACP methyl ester carboxylesterase